MKKNETNQQKRKQGGQPGNQNARTHGLYSKHLSPEDHRALQAAAGVSELDYEIALLRAKALSILDHDPDNTVLFLALSALARAMQARQRLVSASPDGLAEAVKNTLAGVSLPPGGNSAGGEGRFRTLGTNSNARLRKPIRHEENSKKAFQLKRLRAWAVPARKPSSPENATPRNENESALFPMLEAIMDGRLS